MRVVLGGQYKLNSKEYTPEVWEEIINYTATILDENPATSFALPRNNDGYVTSGQLYTPLPKFNDGFTNYKYKQIDNGDGTATVSIMIDTLKERPTKIIFGDYNNGNGATETTKTLLKVDKLNTKGITGAISMFSNCINLKYINTTLMNTSNVTNMAYMFFNCKSLT